MQYRFDNSLICLCNTERFLMTRSLILNPPPTCASSPFIFRVDSVKLQALQYVKEVREGCMYTLHKDDCFCRPSFVCDAVSSDRK
jgi:hypothetical protein